MMICRKVTTTLTQCAHKVKLMRARIMLDSHEHKDKLYDCIYLKSCPHHLVEIVGGDRPDWVILENDKSSGWEIPRCPKQVLGT